MITLRKLELEDLEEYKYWKLPKHQYHSLNGPYFRKKTAKEVEAYIENLKNSFQKENNVLENVRIISDNQNKIIGEVSWYWKSEETNWLEIGIVIFDENFWGQGIGYSALKLWIEEVFFLKKELIRIGLTTWSGNQGMVKLAQKIGMKEEARYRKARIVDNKYYDSVSYGILKDEWKNN